MKHYQSWQFREELKKTVIESLNLKPKTVSGKLNRILDKYEGLFLRWSGQLDKLYEENSTNIKIIAALKSGAINFNGGFIKLDNISHVRTEDNTIHCYMKDGNCINLSLAFSYIMDLVRR